MIRTHAFGLLAVFFGSVAAAATPFPYRAIVQTQEATLRSGPGTTYYATDILEKGEVVEVFRHVDNTWCAIRPTAGSFSWVLAQDVEATDANKLLRVIGSGSKTRVGSNLTQSNNVEYVSLNQDEILKSLGPAQRLPGKSQLAYRVEPPSGEFRWIHHRYLVRVDEADETSEGVTGSGVIKAAYEQDDDSVRLEKLPRASMETVPIPGQASTSRNSQPRKTVATTRRNYEDAVQLQRKLKRLSAYLSQTVARPVDGWNLAPLQAEIEDVIANTRDIKTQRDAKQLLNRLAEFDRLQRRHQALASNRRSPTRSPARSPARSNVPNRASQVTYQQPIEVPQKSAELKDIIPWSILPSNPKKAPTAATVYEGEGWLIPVFTNRRDLPSFALTDDDGAILYFVTPRPGLNLRRYLRKRVGIVGAVEKTAANEQAQLTAQRIIVLDRHRR